MYILNNGWFVAVCHLQKYVLTDIDVVLGQQIVAFQHGNFGTIVLLAQMSERDMLCAVLHKVKCRLCGIFI